MCHTKTPAPFVSTQSLTDAPLACIILSYNEEENMKRGRVPLTVSVPSELAAKFEKFAKLRRRTRASSSVRWSPCTSSAGRKRNFSPFNAMAPDKPARKGC